MNQAQPNTATLKAHRDFQAPPPAVVKDAITFTIWQDERGTRKADKTMPWSALPDLLRKAPHRQAKMACPLIKLATFGNQCTEKGSLRHDANMLEVTGIEGDYDAEEISIQDARIRLEDHRIRAILYPSFSSTPEKPRWRVLAPLSKPAALSERIRFAEALNGVLGGILAPETAVLSQSYFYGWPPGVEPQVLVTFDDPEDGVCLDDLDHLDELRQPFSGKVAVDGTIRKTSDYLAELLDGEDVHGNALRVVGQMVNIGLSDDIIRATFEALSVEVGKARGKVRAMALIGGELTRMIEGARNKGFAPPPPVDCSAILLKPNKEATDTLYPGEIDRLLSWAARTGATLPSAEAAGIFAGPINTQTKKPMELHRVPVTGSKYSTPWRSVLWRHGQDGFMTGVDQYLPNRANMVDGENAKRMDKGEEPQADIPPEELRDHAASWLAGILALSVSDEEGQALLARLPDPWPEPRPLPRRGDMDQPREFPIALLPDVVQCAAAEVGRFVKAPPAAAAIVGLSVLAVAIGKRAVVEERPGLLHSPASFFVGIAASGERKSPVFRQMTYPLQMWAEQEIVIWKELAKVASATNAAIDAAILGVKAKARGGSAVADVANEIADLEAKRIEPPPYPRMFTTDSTEQRLFQLMDQRDGAFAVLSGEGRPVIDSLCGKYSGDGRTGDGIFLAGVSGDTITRDRVGGEGGPEERIIVNPCLTTCILVQPDKYLEAAGHPSLRDSGALARIWPVWLPSLVGTRMEAKGEKGLGKAEMADYNATVVQLLKHIPPRDEYGNIVPHCVTLGPEATEARRQFHNAIESQMATGHDLEDVRDIASKSVSQTTKLAMILHLAQAPELLIQGASEIGATTWASAQALGTWFLEEATRVQRLADEDPDIETARRVLAWLASDSHRLNITTTEVSQTGPRPRPKAVKAREILELLGDYNWLKPENPTARRKTIWRLHPKLANLAKLAKEDATE